MFEFLNTLPINILICIFKLIRYLLRMNDSQWLKMIYQWTPDGRTRRGRSQQSWKNQVIDLMKSRDVEEVMAENR